MRIDEGHFGDVDLSGLSWGGMFAWPKAIHEGHGEAFASEPPGDSRPKPGADTQNRCHFHTLLLSRSVHALPTGNSYASSDSGFISML